MRKALCGLAIILTGCAGYIDETAIPNAQMGWKLALERCAAERHATVNEAMTCILAADRGLVTAIKLRDMAVFEAYAERQRLLAADASEARITPEQTGARFTANRTDLFTAIAQGDAADRAQRARTAAAFMAMGASMQAAGASYNAGLAANRPINCTTLPLYAGASTTTCN